ncbi:MAG: dephospho-CoA kinase [Oscillospiraceae bacterium]|nr:dephospho-CoA kinase [Oscillospiraceae bacterium]
MKKIIGITGGTGCGKTTVLRVLQELGFHIIDCDRVYHRLLEEDTQMLRAIDDRFPGVVKDGKLRRKELGRVVFSNEAALDTLNKTVWPFVRRAVQEEVDRTDEPCAIDAIGLFESGLHDLCTHTVAVTAPKDARIRRLMARDDIPEDYAALRIDAQKDNEYFAARCGLILENRFSTEEDFRRYTAQMLKETIL